MLLCFFFADFVHVELDDTTVRDGDDDLSMISTRAVVSEPISRRPVRDSATRARLALQCKVYTIYFCVYLIEFYFN